MDYAIHYGVDTMTKKKVWMSFWIVMILLLTCTVLSLWVEKMMRIEVVTVPGIIDEETNTVRIPKSCYQFDEWKSAFFFLKEKEGLFGTELVVEKREKPPMYEEGGEAVLPSSDVFDDAGNPLEIIREATWPIQRGDVVVRKEEREFLVEREMWILTALFASLLPGILLLSRSVRKLGTLQEGNIKGGIEGILLIGIWLCVLYVLMGQLHIPRQYLPQEHILDIKFYIKELRRFEFIQHHKQQALISGGFILGVWSVSVLLKWWLSKRFKLTSGMNRPSRKFPSIL